MSAAMPAASGPATTGTTRCSETSATTPQAAGSAACKAAAIIRSAPGCSASRAITTGRASTVPAPIQRLPRWPMPRSFRGDSRLPIRRSSSRWDRSPGGSAIPGIASSPTLRPAALGCRPRTPCRTRELRSQRRARRRAAGPSASAQLLNREPSKVGEPRYPRGSFAFGIAEDGPRDKPQGDAGQKIR